MFTFRRSVAAAAMTLLASAAAISNNIGPASAEQIAGFPTTIVQRAGGTCLGANGGDNKQVRIYDCNGGTSQQWVFTPKYPLGSYEVKNVYSGKCLDVTGGSTSIGTVVQQYPCYGSTHQLWYYNSSSGFLTAVHSNLCIAVAHPFPGTGAYQHACSGGSGALYTTWNTAPY
ncbi:RICIN domain-containing protein [Micromonospora echinospora]|uniref:RICIN domain-containing protein n=1 Tax=Micromonospora echinospora TaxID=1877 RepID=UPI00366B7F6C